MKRNFAETFIEPEEETLARLGYHVDPAGEFLPNWAPPASGAGLEAGNHVEVTYPVHIDPQLSASAGDTQQNQEPLFPDDDDHDDDTAAAQGVEFDRGFCRDRFPEENMFVHSVDQDPVEDPAEGHSVPEPQQQTQQNQHAATPAANPQPPTWAKKPRKPKDKPDATGRHSAAEISTVEDFKIQFCHDNNMSGEDFGRMVQHCETGRGDFPCPESVMTRSEFWAHLYALMPGRRHRDVHRYMRSHYVATSQKPRQWTRAQDDELAALHAEHGPDFAKIARILGRARDDVNTRFRKHVQHRDTQNHGPWTDEECVRLEDAVRQWRDSQLPEDDNNTTGFSLPEDIYQIDPHDIRWTRVSELIGHTRTREQCSAKWKAMRKKMEGEGGGDDTGPR